jgi:hypothetical protein
MCLWDLTYTYSRSFISLIFLKSNRSYGTTNQTKHHLKGLNWNFVLYIIGYIILLDSYTCTN